MLRCLDGGFGPRFSWRVVMGFLVLIAILGAFWIIFKP
jgi:hypothetical protein